MQLSVSGSGHENSSGFAGFGNSADDDLHIAAQRIQKAQKAFHGEAIELIIHQRGNLRLRDAQQVCGCRLRKAALLDDLMDGDCETHLSLSFIRARESKVGEDVARASGHCPASFALCHKAFWCAKPLSHF